MDLFLRKPTIEDKKEIMQYVEAFRLSGQELHGGSYIDTYESFEAWLDFIESIENPNHPLENLVPAHQYLLVDNHHKVIGMLNLRLELNDYLANFGGHIGYSIHPNLQGMGFGKKILSLVIPIAYDLKIYRLLITADQENIASQKVIENAGGIYADKRQDKDGNWVKRYWLAVDEVIHGKTE